MGATPSKEEERQHGGTVNESEHDAVKAESEQQFSRSEKKSIGVVNTAIRLAIDGILVIENYIEEKTSGQSDPKRKPAPDSRTVEHYPILIFPGLLSSCLKIEETPFSQIKGKQAWLNIRAMGYGALYKGSPLMTKIQDAQTNTIDAETLELYQAEDRAKNVWLEHIRLQPDQVSEKEDVRLRPVSGIKGVDYLLPENSPVKNAAWVFGPLIKLLKQRGYEEGLDLDAATYDWRLPPIVSEQRNGYFSKTIKRVEQMYNDNNETPVVLLCHSLGSKAAHYFLNFALASKGRAWIDQHIHAYVPVGAPHAGASQAFRAAVNEGDTMGLDAFMSDEEGLLLARSMGSLMWLFPTTLPASVPPTLIMKQAGFLRVAITSPLPVQRLLRDRASHAVRLTITFGNVTLHSKFYEPNKKGNIYFPCTFCFPTPPLQPNREKGGWGKKLHISIEEPGYVLKKRSWLPFDKRVIFDLPVRQTELGLLACFPCLVVRHTAQITSKTVMKIADKAVEKTGATTTVGVCPEIDVDAVLSQGVPAEVSSILVAQKKSLGIGRGDSRKRTQINFEMKMYWEPGDKRDVEIETTECSPVCEPSPDRIMPPILDTSGNSGKYLSLDGKYLIAREKQLQSLKTLRDYYDNDPHGPRTSSSLQAPPVKRVLAIYGINLPTEVGAIYRPNERVEEPGHVPKHWSRDLDAKLSRPGSHALTEGMLMETQRTPQVCSDGTAMTGSGDGTVPYFSLQQPKAWKDDCDVRVEEIPGAGHREILGDSRFHRILLDYVTNLT